MATSTSAGGGAPWLTSTAHSIATRSSAVTAQTMSHSRQYASIVWRDSIKLTRARRVCPRCDCFCLQVGQVEAKVNGFFIRCLLAIILVVSLPGPRWLGRPLMSLLFSLNGSFVRAPVPAVTLRQPSVQEQSIFWAGARERAKSANCTRDDCGNVA